MPKAICWRAKPRIDPVPMTSLPARVAFAAKLDKFDALIHDADEASRVAPSGSEKRTVPVAESSQPTFSEGPTTSKGLVTVRRSGAEAGDAADAVETAEAAGAAALGLSAGTADLLTLVDNTIQSRSESGTFRHIELVAMDKSNPTIPRFGLGGGGEKVKKTEPKTTRSVTRPITNLVLSPKNANTDSTKTDTRTRIARAGAAGCLAAIFVAQATNARHPDGSSGFVTMLPSNLQGSTQQSKR